MTKVLVTGAAGYVGARLARTLARDGVHVRALVRRRLPWLEIDDVVAAELDDASEALSAACAGVDAVVHLAAPNEAVAACHPEGAFTETALGARRMVMAAAAAGVPRFVYVSTVHVYGAAAFEGAVLGEDVVPRPRDAYAVARLAGEHLTSTVDGVDTVVVRLTNCVGAPAHPSVERWTLVVNDLCRQGAVRGHLRLRTHGLQWRDFLSMEDACRLLAACTARERVPAGTYNLGSGQPTTVRELAEMVRDAFEELTDRRPPLDAPDPPDEPPKPHFVDIGRLAALGLRATGDLRSAVAETAQFCQQHRDELAG